MSSEPLVSVVLPTYNRSASLERAIQSVLRQTESDLELIVVDDCSSEDPQAVVAHAARGDSRVRYVRRPVNGGAAAARNTGLALARGRFLAFQDSDDEWLAGKLERQLLALKQAGPGTAMCVSGYFMSRPDWWYRVCYLGRPNLLYPDDLGRQALENFFFPTPTWLVPREVLDKAGRFDEELRCWEDWELAIRIGGHGRVLLLDEPLHLQYSAAGSVNNQERAWGPAMRRIVTRHEALWAGAPRTLAQHCYLIGRIECLYGDTPEGRRWLRKALKLDPFAFRAAAALAVSALGDSAYRNLVQWSRRMRDQTWRERLKARSRLSRIDAADASERRV